MKYKLIGIFGIFVILLAAAAAPVLEADVKESPRIHQHLTARRDTGCDCGGTELCSHLPLVIIDTEGRTIPGRPTGNRDFFDQAIYSAAEDGGPTINAAVRVIDHPDRNNHPSDEPAFTTRSELRVRGNSSRAFPKTPYQMNFVDGAGLNRDISVMGMPAHHEWALHGPILDKSLVRNYMWYNISGEIMEYAPNCRFCELILDGSYEGLYLMTETVTNGDGCRLNLSRSTKNAKTYGYLLRVDRPTEADLGTPQDIYTYSERSDQILHDMAVRYPGRATLTPEMAESIELDYSAFEKALFSYDHDTQQYGYWNWIDVDNFIDYFLIAEFTKNIDMGKYSTYLYKEVGQKYRLCVWDFNNACDNYQDNATEPDSFLLVKRAWFFMLLKNEEFVERVLNRYADLRRGVLSEEYLLNYIDEALDWLGPAVERNNWRWADAIEHWNGLTPEERNLHSHREAVAQLKDWIVERGDWLDYCIHALRQYAHPSRNKKFNH